MISLVACSLEDKWVLGDDSELEQDISRRNRKIIPRTWSVNMSGRKHSSGNHNGVRI